MHLVEIPESNHCICSAAVHMDYDSIRILWCGLLSPNPLILSVDVTCFFLLVYIPNC